MMNRIHERNQIEYFFFFSPCGWYVVMTLFIIIEQQQQGSPVCVYKFISDSSLY